MKLKLPFKLLLIFSGFFTTVLADPPTPDKGERWVLDRTFSDEFNGDQLDPEKWQKGFDGWLGRRPGLFVDEAISVKDGSMQIKCGVLDNPFNGYTIQGGAVQSKSKQASYGYYECNFKASRISMSTTFWLSSDNKRVNQITKKSNGVDCPRDRFSQELDICEVVGAIENFPEFRKQMNFKAHYWYDDCDGVRTSYNVNNYGLEPNPNNQSATLSSEVWEDFHTYGSYWKDENNVSFYANDRFLGDAKLRTDVVDTPYTEKMRMNFVNETYTWVSPQPTNEELNDDSINTSYYNWVRSYKLIPADQVYQPNIIKERINFVENGNFENGTLDNWIGWGANRKDAPVTTNAANGSYSIEINGAGAYEQVVTLKANTNYTLSAKIKVLSGSVNLGIKANNNIGQTLGVDTFNTTDLATKTITFNSGNTTNAKFFFFAPSTNDAAIGDDFELYETDTTSPDDTSLEIYTEEIQFDETPQIIEQNINFSYLYKSNYDRTAKLIVKNSDTSIVYENQFPILGGFASDLKTVITPDILEDKEYIISAQIIDTNTNTVIASTENVTVQNPNYVEPIIDTIAFGSNARTLISANSYDVVMDYASNDQNDIIVELWSATGFVGIGRATVERGIDGVTISVNTPNAPQEGSGYFYKGYMVPVGANYTQIIANATNFDEITVISSAFAVPGTIQAEDFISKNGKVQVEDTPGTNDQNLGFIRTDDYTEYYIDVAQAGTYTIEALVSSNAQGGDINFIIDDVTIAVLTVEGNGAWHDYQVVSTQVDLNAGLQKLRLSYTSQNLELYNLDRFSFAEVIDTSSSEENQVLAFPNPTSNLLTVSSTKEQNKTIEILNFNGMLLQTQVTDTKAQQIDLSPYPKGIYFIKVTDNETGTNQMISVVKE